MRLSRFLSLYVGLSRNQSKFFIRKGRVFVDSTPISDPDLEVSHENCVVFDGNLVKAVDYRYILVNKPRAYECSVKTSSAKSICELLPRDVGDRQLHFANAVLAQHTGLVLISDNARWISMMAKKMSKRPRLFYASLTRPVNDTQLRALQAACDELSGSVSHAAIDMQRESHNVLRLSVARARVSLAFDLFHSMDLVIETLHLQRVGRLDLGDLSVGQFLELSEEGIKI